MRVYVELLSGRMANYQTASRVYADWCDDHGDDARAARRRLKAETVRTPGLLWPRPGLLPGLSPHQAAELRKSLSRPLGLLVGTPGTGKTFATARVVSDLFQRYGSDAIAVCAPTGKAAVRITEAIQGHGTPITARTIHSLLEIGRNGHDGLGWGFQRDAANPLDQKFVIIDEASMLDTSLFASLLLACRPGTHLFLVGDPNQLPPVGHGAPLRDLIAAGAPCGTLSEVRRNAGLIVEACTAIRQGQPFAFAGKASEGNLIVLETREPERQVEAMKELLGGLADEGLDPAWDAQVLVATNSSGPLSRDQVNKRLQQLLNPHGERAEGNPYRVGDKLICLRNGIYESHGVHANEPEHWLANGEIGRVVAVEPRRIIAEFDGPRRVLIPLGKQQEGEEAAGAQFDLAYGVTTHKSQGSEWPVVIVLVDASPGAARVAGREWLYTAVSRAKQACYLVGRYGVACTMARRPALESRKTFLADLLRL